MKCSLFLLFQKDSLAKDKDAHKKNNAVKMK